MSNLPPPRLALQLWSFTANSSLSGKIDISGIPHNGTRDLAWHVPIEGHIHRLRQHPSYYCPKMSSRPMDGQTVIW